MQVDPGGSPDHMPGMGEDIDSMGLLPESAQHAGTGPSMDAANGGAATAGNGSVSGTGAQGGQVGGGSRVPGSLRAYVRRYLERVGAGGTGTSSQ